MNKSEKKVYALLAEKQKLNSNKYKKPETLSPRMKIRSILLKYSCDQIKGVYGARRKQKQISQSLKIFCASNK